MRKLITLMIVLALATTAFAQTKPAAPAAQQAATDPIIIAAGDLSVRQSEFENAIETLPQEYRQFAMGPGKKQFAEDYLRMKMLAAQGVKAGLDKDPEVVRQLALMRENLVANAQLKRIEENVAVSDADLQKAYEANKAQYEQVKARHILIAFKGSPAADPEKTELTEEQAKAKAEDIRKQLVAGASFEELAKKESDDKGSGARGGDLGSFGRGMMVDEFEDAAFAAKVGEIAPVVRTQFGYHIIKVDEHKTTPFAEVKEQLERTERQKKVQEALDAMKENAKPTFNDAYFAAAAATPPVQQQ
ncbi:MAG TPA: peptidylprolyl isomerase [Thermoanaerobaculia bacterium]|nr:peptidylprolyl isomerase [Thermoanaerobaculia bacterium]